MNFIHKILGTNRAGYAALPPCPTGSPCANSPEVPDPSSREYAELKEKTIRIIAAMPAQYLSADKGRTAIEAIRSGEPGHEALYTEVWDAAMAYSRDIAAGRITKPTR
ncbi:hypothetical protein pqer_cds_319 [Pandoravirus quercus]|uniref:Uncharacterized protein n=2 Tax=Pandoravirus TaxID=2060084 RepID=A0A2U7U8H2_9VIRU|nr:hypothetical protein pqer_cds_319 [Pandoravirus quercus]AVK74741.1 hypothetical protein pqer_cds_319 [Pandoravirus quercus]QBZ80918.1 hypothetical protein pclt_cds_320 [Pandoravirus celtis]